MADQNFEQEPINIELSEEMAEGTYANLVMIAHNNTEFVLDFIRMAPGVNKAKVKSRIVLTPEHAVRFYEALRENLARYEQAFGPIKQHPEGLNNPFNFGGGNNMGQA